MIKKGPLCVEKVLRKEIYLLKDYKDSKQLNDNTDERNEEMLVKVQTESLTM